MKKSITGYKKNSKDKNEPILEIPSSNITMRDVLHPVFSIGTQGVDVMEPGYDYKFNTGSTIEIPYKMKKQKGGTIKDSIKNRELVMKETRPMTAQARAADVYGNSNNYPTIPFPKRGSGKTKSRDRYREKEQGGVVKEFESYLSSLEEIDQDELLDYMETMDYENQQEFLKGGRVQWESYQKGGLLTQPVDSPSTNYYNPTIRKVGDMNDGKKSLLLDEIESVTPSPQRPLAVGGGTGQSNKIKSRDRFREQEQGGLIYQDGGETSLQKISKDFSNITEGEFEIDAVTPELLQFLKSNGYDYNIL